MERVKLISWEKISLVIPEMEDLEVMLHWINNIDISKNLWPIKHQTRISEEKYLKSLIDERKKQFMIMINKTQEIIGSVWFNEYSEISRNWLIWICIYSENNLWKWYWTQAMNLFLKYVFEYLWYHKVKLNVFTDNKRAINSYKKSWFRKVWIHKEDVYIMWEYKDHLSMELLRSEYKNLKS